MKVRDVQPLQWLRIRLRRRMGSSSAPRPSGIVQQPDVPLWRPWRLAALMAGFGIASALLFFDFYRDAKDAAVRNLTHEQRTHARQAAHGIQDFFGTWTSTLSALGKMDGVVDASAVGRQTMALFYEAHKGQIRSITRMDERGTILAAYPSERSAGSDISNQQHVREMLRDHRPVVSDVFRAVQGFDAVALHVPVFEGTRFKGSIAVVINFESLARNYFDVIKIGETSHAWVISRDGTLLYTPERGLTGTSAFEAFHDFPSVTALLTRMVQGREGAVIYTMPSTRSPAPRPTRFYALYEPIRIGHTFWSVVVASSEGEMLAGLNSFRNHLALVIGLVFMGGLLGAVVVVRARLIVEEEGKRRRAEEAVRSSERLRAMMHDAITDVLFYLGVEADGGYRFLSANPAFLNTTGLSESDVIGRSVQEVIPEPALGIALEKYAEAIASRKTVTWHETSAYPAGSRHGEVSITPVFDAGGRCTHLFGTVHDVTDQRVAEAALRKSEERYRMLFENGPQPTIVVDDETDRVVATNEAAFRQFGYDIAELLACRLADIVDRGDRERVAQALHQSDRSRKYSDLAFRRKDGSIFLADVALGTIAYERRPSRLVVITDVTERATARRALSDAQWFHEELISSAGEGIVAFDRELRVLVWNRFMEAPDGESRPGCRRQERDFVVAFPAHFFGERVAQHPSIRRTPNHRVHSRTAGRSVLVAAGLGAVLGPVQLRSSG